MGAPDSISNGCNGSLAAFTQENRPGSVGCGIAAVSPGDLCAKQVTRDLNLLSFPLDLLTPHMIVQTRFSP